MQRETTCYGLAVPKKHTKRWEHRTLDVAGRSERRSYDNEWEEYRDPRFVADTAQDQLNLLGQQGWELVAVSVGVAFLKREV